MADLDLDALRALAERVKAFPLVPAATPDFWSALSPDVVVALLDQLERAERATDGQGCTECAAEVGVHVGADTGLCAGHVAMLYDRLERAEKDLESAVHERIEARLATVAHVHEHIWRGEAVDPILEAKDELEAEQARAARPTRRGLVATVTLFSRHPRTFVRTGCSCRLGRWCPVAFVLDALDRWAARS